MPVVLHAVERVLDDEAVVERVDDPVVVRAPALALVAVGKRGDVLGARGVAPEHVVPDDAVVGIQLLDDVDAPVLVRVEELLAQLADLVLVHHRRAELPRVQVLEQLRDLPVAHLGDEARRQRHLRSVVGHDGHRVLHDEAVVEGADDAIVVGAPPVEVTSLDERVEVLVPADLLAGDVEPQRHVGRVAPVDRLDVAALDRVEKRVAQAAMLGVDRRHDEPSAFSSARPKSRPAASTSKIV